MAKRDLRALHRESSAESRHLADQRFDRRNLLLIERELRFFKKEAAYWKLKAERLELMALSQRPGGAAYVDRTERPNIGDVQVATKATGFGRLRQQWDKLSEADQEAYMAKGDWTPDEKTAKRSN